MSYQTFKAQWNGKRVDYDGVYGFQCVDLIKQYLAQEYGMKPGAWGNAIEYWTATHPTLLTKFDKLTTSSVRTGDIVIFKGVNGSPYGHIGIADGSSSLLYVPTLEQNGATGNGSGTGGDAIRVRNIPRWRVVGILRTKEAKPATKMPNVGARIKLTKGITRNTFRAGTTTVAGTIRVTDESFIYEVRGYDAKYPNRILINSKSAGGDGVALALYYTNGTKIDGWTQI